MTLVSASLVSLELEQLVLGGLLADQRGLDGVAAVLAPEHFSEVAHAKIYATILEKAQFGPLDAALIAPLFAQDPLLSTAGAQGQGGAVYIRELEAAALVRAPLTAYARELLDLAQRRALLDEFARFSADVSDLESPLEPLIRAADTALLTIAKQGTGPAPRPLALAQRDALAALNAELSAPDSAAMQTGFARLDALLRGLRPGQMTVLAGRPGMGKTALALHLAADLAARGRAALYVTIEMAEAELMARLAAPDLGFDFGELSITRNPNFEAQTAAARTWLSTARTTPLHILDVAGPSLNQVRAQARHLRRTAGLELIVIDYLQLLSATRQGESTIDTVTRNSRGLKALARELGVHVLLLCQLNRGVENREDKRPLLQDLRDSGGIEQDADKVVMLYREATYLRQDLEALKAAASVGKPGAEGYYQSALADYRACEKHLELIVRKNRRGRVGAATIGWDQGKMRFWSLSKEGERHVT